MTVAPPEPVKPRRGLTVQSGTSATCALQRGSLSARHSPFDVAFKYRAALAEEAYKKLRLIWNGTLSQARELQIFQSTSGPVLTYVLDALTLTMPHMKGFDTYYIRFLRRVFGVKASYYSRIPTRKSTIGPTDPNRLPKP